MLRAIGCFSGLVRGKANTRRLAECRRRATKINTEQAYRLSLERRVHMKIEHGIFRLKD